MPSLSGALPSASALTVNSTGIFDIVSVNETISSLAGSGTVNLGSGTLTVNGSTSTTFSGVIQDAPGEVYVANSTSQPGLWGYYYNANNPGFTGTPAMRLDTTVNFSDLTTQQPSGINSTQFTARWVGQLLTTSSGGTYTFWTSSDDGSRLWVNGQLVVNNWDYHGATAVTNTISLSANTYYDIRLEYEQGVGGALCVLNWIPPGGTSAVIPSSNLSTYAGYGGLVKSGGSTLTLSGANTYQGATTVSGGTLYGSVSRSIPGNVTVSAGTLELGSPSAMSSGATLALASSPAAGAVNLNFTGIQTISALNFGSTLMAQGTWGSTSSSAAHQNAAFTGTGLLNVTSGGTSQTISFSNPGTQTYGVAPITLGATAPGGTVTYTVTSGPASVAGST